MSMAETLKIFSNIVNSMTANVEKLTVCGNFRNCDLCNNTNNNLEILIYVGQIQTHMGT